MRQRNPRIWLQKSEAQEYSMTVGKVKWFDESKGYGFIESESGEEVFVHYSTITMEGFKTLKDGQAVEYEFTQGKKGLQATRVVPVVDVAE